MRIGISVYDLPSADVIDLARAADGLGFDSVWLGEHLLFPVGYQTTHPSAGSGGDRRHGTLRDGKAVTEGTELPDSWVLLGALAAATSRLNLHTGIYILPARHPLMTARAAATVWELSRGRFVLGVGLGWLAEELEAVGVPFGERLSRFEESIPILRAAWTGRPFSHSGGHWTFPEVQSCKAADIPLVFAGNSKSALLRAAKHGDGWYVSGIPVIHEMLELRRRLLKIRGELGRTATFRCYLRVHDPTPSDLEMLQEAGVEDVVVLYQSVWPNGSEDQKLDALSRAAERYGISGS